jgi:hypothetical protein
MIQASSNLGTMATDMAMRQILPDATPLACEFPGNAEHGQFDRVYQDGDTIYIVESKGAGSEHGSRKELNGQQSQQGTPEYIASVIANMDKKVEDGFEDPKYGVDAEFTDKINKLSETAGKLKTAQNSTPPKIVSLQISQHVDSKGNLAPSVEVKKFENQSQKAPKN